MLPLSVMLVLNSKRYVLGIIETSSKSAPSRVRWNAVYLFYKIISTLRLFSANIQSDPVGIPIVYLRSVTNWIDDVHTGEPLMAPKPGGDKVVD